MLCAGRALTGVVLLTGTVPGPLDETDFGIRRSGPREADRAGVRFTGWKIAPLFGYNVLWNDYMKRGFREVKEIIKILKNGFN